MDQNYDIVKQAAMELLVLAKNNKVTTFNLHRFIADLDLEYMQAICEHEPGERIEHAIHGAFKMINCKKCGKLIDIERL